MYKITILTTFQSNIIKDIHKKHVKAGGTLDFNEVTTLSMLDPIIFTPSKYRYAHIVKIDRLNVWSIKNAKLVISFNDLQPITPTSKPLKQEMVALPVNKPKKVYPARGVRNSKAVEGTHTKTGDVVTFKSTIDADRNGFDQAAISRCCNGKSKSHLGYKWKFI